MPRPRDDYFKDFDKFKSLLSGIPVEGITDYENDRLTSSLCQLFIEKYNEEITDEHAKNYKPVQKHTTLVLTVFLSMVEDGGEFPSTVFFYSLVFMIEHSKFFREQFAWEHENWLILLKEVREPV